MEMSDHPAAAEPLAGEPNPGLRAAALTAVIAGLVVVAGAAFVLSYQGIHQIALHAGVSPELARLYPVILDAMLVMSCAAALALRTARLWTRCYVWACLILLLVAVATGDALYAMSISLPAQPTRPVVAVLPWALLLMGFGMLLAMLRHWRRLQATIADTGQTGPARPGDGAAAAGTPAAIANGKATESKRPGPATMPEHTGVAGAAPAATRAAGTVRAATPAADPVPVPAPAAGAAGQPGATVPLLDRIPSGPANPHAPEAGGG